MTKFITLLRGINVGGHKKVLKKDLHKIFSKLGFSNIQTIAQTGNIIFESEKEISTDEISALVKEAIKKRYEFEIEVQSRTEKEFLEIFAKNPFKEFEEKKLYIAFADQEIKTENKIEVEKFLPDKFSIQKKSIFVLYDTKISDSKLTNNFFENLSPLVISPVLAMSFGSSPANRRTELGANPYSSSRNISGDKITTASGSTSETI